MELQFTAEFTVRQQFLPGERSVWCAEEMMTFREVPDYAYRDFWSQKPVAVNR